MKSKCTIEKNPNVLKQSQLIQIISDRSDRYGNMLLDFMSTYNLMSLREATVEQLSEYIKNNLEGVKENGRKRIN